MEYNNIVNSCHVYNDFVENNLILNKKKKYTLKDFKKLNKLGYTQLQSRFIIICSNIYHNGVDNIDGISKVFYKENFTYKCRYNLI